MFITFWTWKSSFKSSWIWRGIGAFIYVIFPSLLSVYAPAMPAPPSHTHNAWTIHRIIIAWCYRYFFLIAVVVCCCFHLCYFIVSLTFFVFILGVRNFVRCLSLDRSKNSILPCAFAKIIAMPFEFSVTVCASVFTLLHMQHINSKLFLIIFFLIFFSFFVADSCQFWCFSYKVRRKTNQYASFWIK